jgi:hypothetical protein
MLQVVSTVPMPSQITSQQYGQAVLEHVQNGAYPEEELISAQLPSSALPEVWKLIEQARKDVKVCLDSVLPSDSINSCWNRRV